MGRKPTRWLNLPRGMRARERGAKVYYYLDLGGKPRQEQPLGTDYTVAVKRWSELVERPTPAGGIITVPYALARYFADVVPSKAAGSQRSDEQERKWLDAFFGDPPAPLDQVQPVHVRQFMRWRAEQARKAALAKGRDVPKTFGQVRANRAKALLSHFWNWCRAEGLTALPNPCAGIPRFAEAGRETAPTAELVQLLLAAADQPLAFAIRLADIVGQRPGDVRALTEADVRDGMLHVRQGKTKAKLRIEIVGALAVLLDEIRAYKRERKVAALALLVNEAGQPLSRDAMRFRFDKARAAAGIAKADLQFRDFRAKAATDTDEAAGTRAAQALLGHTTEAMTANYIRHKVGKKVRPIR
jgi:integrase